MKRNQVFVRAKWPEGGWGSVDVFDLDDESFRAFVVEILEGNKLVLSLRASVVPGSEMELTAKRGVKPKEKETSA